MQPIRCIILLICFCVVTPAPLMGQQNHSNATAATAEPVWRLTKHGWQDASSWSVNLEALSRPIERVHPLLLGVNIVLAALFALIWCSEEQQVARFLGRPELNDDTDVG